jgi:hypothetical protein
MPRGIPTSAGPTRADGVRAKLAVAVLRTLRAEREARAEGRPLGERSLLRLYLRNRADLDPEATVSSDDPGAEFVLQLARGGHDGVS